jgi:hypothetical protein
MSLVLLIARCARLRVCKERYLDHVRVFNKDTMAQAGLKSSRSMSTDGRVIKVESDIKPLLFAQNRKVVNCFMYEKQLPPSATASGTQLQIRKVSRRVRQV